MCAKNCGLYFSLTPAGKASKVFCAEHGAAEQEKDSVLLAKRLAGVTPKMTKASQRKAQEDIRRRDLVELQRLENELYRMQALRLNLEQVRQLLDLCKRREKIKKVVRNDGAGGLQDGAGARPLGDPRAAGEARLVRDANPGPPRRCMGSQPLSNPSPAWARHLRRSS